MKQLGKGFAPAGQLGKHLKWVLTEKGTNRSNDMLGIFQHTHWSYAEMWRVDKANYALLKQVAWKRKDLGAK